MISLSSRKLGQVTAIQVLEQQIDSTNSRHLFEAAVQDTVPPYRLVLDLTEVSYVDSSGIGVILRILRENRERGGDLRLCCLQSPVAQIFQLVGLPNLMRTYDSCQEAVDSYGS